MLIDLYGAIVKETNNTSKLSRYLKQSRFPVAVGQMWLEWESQKVLIC